MTDGVLVVNTGSSSLKASVLDPGGRVTAALSLDRWDGSPDHETLTSFINEWRGVTAVGHRVVHGGSRFTGPALIDAAVLAGIRELASLAPLHQPRALAGIAAVSALLPGVPAVACFDTAFHAGLPAAAAAYALPGDWVRRFGLRRFGFHGLSHAWAARRAAELTGEPGLRVVTCHLGAGASLAAVRDGRSVDTTMGFTPLEGLVMATRSGSVDPGLILWLMTRGGLAAAEVSDKLEHESGLAGLSGLPGGDLRDVHAAAAAGSPGAELAVAVYLHRLRREIAAMAAALGGLDALAFTGGTGEHDPVIRAGAAAGLGFLGVAVDARRNEAVSHDTGSHSTSGPDPGTHDPGTHDPGTGDADITAPGAAVRTLVITAREDAEIARQARAVVAARHRDQGPGSAGANASASWPPARGDF